MTIRKLNGVLVPFRGKHYQIAPLVWYIETGRASFSSPFGGIIIKSMKVFNRMTEQQPFSSPFGGIIIKSEFKTEKEAMKFVLVPFRGNHYQIESG